MPRSCAVCRRRHSRRHFCYCRRYLESVNWRPQASWPRQAPIYPLFRQLKRWQAGRDSVQEIERAPENERGARPQRATLTYALDSAGNYEHSYQDKKNNGNALSSFSRSTLVGFDTQRSEVRLYRCVWHSWRIQSTLALQHLFRLVAAQDYTGRFTDRIWRIKGKYSSLSSTPVPMQMETHLSWRYQASLLRQSPDCKGGASDPFTGSDTKAQGRRRKN